MTIKAINATLSESRQIQPGGAEAGIALAASLNARKPDLDVALIDPADSHSHRPGWTMPGAGIFDPATTARTTASPLPAGVRWIKASVAGFERERNAVILAGCRVVTCRALAVAPGITLNRTGIEGLPETVGRRGATSKDRYDLAPYTREWVQNLTAGPPVFTQPPMPIKCPGAPQKAMISSADHWLRSRRLLVIAIDLYNAGAVLFGVKEHDPPLMSCLERYHAQLHVQHMPVKVDGTAQRACFRRTDADGTTSMAETGFDMLHAVPPQMVPDFIRVSPLADAAGWIDMDQATLRHRTLPGIYGLRGACNAPNARTAAAARKQAPVVAPNPLKALGVIQGADALSNGFGSCPLTVERGTIVLAEFGYGGKRLPGFPARLIDDTRPSHVASLLEERMLKPISSKAMLRGKEWLAKPQMAG